MRQVIIVSLNGTAYHLEEDAYNALHKYLDNARRGLRENPDIEEILGDIERSIAEKCAGFLTPGKNVVTGENMAQILAEMGPVQEPEAETEPEPSSEPADGPETAAGPRRLRKRREGAMLDGVCTGLAERFQLDVTLVRILFVLLTLASGFGLAAYLLLTVTMPADDRPTPATAAASSGNRLVVLGAILFVALIGGYVFFNMPMPMHFINFGMPMRVGPFGLVLMLMSPFVALAMIVGGTILLIRHLRS